MDDSIKNFNWHTIKKPKSLPRDEVIKAIERKGCLKLPMTFEPIPVLFRNESLYGFFEKWPSDIDFANFGLDPRRFKEISEEDGIRFHGSGSIKHLLNDWSKVDEVFNRLMPPLDSEWAKSVKEKVSETPNQYHLSMHIFLLFEVIYSLRGMERFFLDLYEERDNVEKLLDRILKYSFEIMKVYGSAGYDGIITSDDWGSQQSLLINPDMWRAIFKPRYEEFFKECHDAGLHVWFHSDGNLDSIFPDLVETGIDVLNPLQPGAIDVDRWLQEYKGELTFWTGVDVQGVLPFATPQKVKDEVRKSIEKFSSNKGGFILGPTNAITAEVPYENLVALYQVLMENR